mgnify:CR=1 FL=1
MNENIDLLAWHHGTNNILFLFLNVSAEARVGQKLEHHGSNNDSTVTRTAYFEFLLSSNKVHSSVACKTNKEKGTKED